MPHDCNGVEVKVGDEVVLRCKVEELYPDTENCNVLIESINTPEIEGTVRTERLCCCSKFIEKTIKMGQAVKIKATGVEGEVHATWLEITARKLYKVVYYDTANRRAESWMTLDEFEVVI